MDEPAEKSCGGGIDVNENSNDSKTVINVNVKHDVLVCKRVDIGLKIPQSTEIVHCIQNSSLLNENRQENFSSTEICNSAQNKLTHMIQEYGITAAACENATPEWNPVLNGTTNQEPGRSSPSKDSLAAVNTFGNLNKISSRDLSLNDISVIENSEPDNLKFHNAFSRTIKQISRDAVRIEDNVVNAVEIDSSEKEQFDAVNTTRSSKIYSQENPIENLINDKVDCNEEANATVVEASDDDADDISPSQPEIQDADAGGFFSQRITQKFRKNTVTDSESSVVPSSLNEVNVFKSPFISNISNQIPMAKIENDGSVSTEKTDLPDTLKTLNGTPRTLKKVNIKANESMKENEVDELNKANVSMKNNCNISFVFSRLTDEQLKELKVLAFRISADISSNIIDGMTTHVVVRPDDGNKAPHTFKYLKGVACRLWVVSSNWVRDCLVAGKLLPEEDYLVLDSSGEPGPLRCKQPDAAPPLKNFIVVPFPPFTSTTTEQVTELITLCGGEIVPLAQLDLKYKSGIPRIILLDSDSDSETIETWLAQYLLVTLNVEWLLEVVGQFKLVPINPYMIALYPKLLLQHLCLPDEVLGEDEEFDDYEDCDVSRT